MNAHLVRVGASAVSRGARETVLVFIPCALVLGVSKHHFTHWPYSSTFQGSATRKPQRLLLKEGVLWKIGWFFSPHHTATALGTSARKQTPQHLKRVRVAVLSKSFSCAVIAWLLAHLAKAASYVSFITQPSAMRSLFVPSESLRSLSLSEHIRTQKVLVRQLCRRVSHRGSDVRLNTGQLMRPDVWPRQPTDPSRWTWKQLHSLKWKHSALQCLSNPVPVLASSMLSRGRQLQSCCAR